MQNAIHFNPGIPHNPVKTFAHRYRNGQLSITEESAVEFIRSIQGGHYGDPFEHGINHFAQLLDSEATREDIATGVALGLLTQSKAYGIDIPACTFELFKHI